MICCFRFLCLVLPIFISSIIFSADEDDKKVKCKGYDWEIYKDDWKWKEFQDNFESATLCEISGLLIKAEDDGKKKIQNFILSFALKAATPWLNGMSMGAFSLFLGSAGNQQDNMGMIIEKITQIIKEALEAHYQTLFKDQKEAFFKTFEVYRVGTSQISMAKFSESLENGEELSPLDDKVFDHIIRTLEDLSNQGVALVAKNGIFGPEIVNRHKVALPYQLIATLLASIWKEMDFLLHLSYSKNTELILIPTLVAMHSELVQKVNSEIIGPELLFFEKIYYLDIKIPWIEPFLIWEVIAPNMGIFDFCGFSEPFDCVVYEKEGRERRGRLYFKPKDRTSTSSFALANKAKKFILKHRYNELMSESFGESTDKALHDLSTAAKINPPIRLCLQASSKLIADVCLPLPITEAPTAKPTKKPTFFPTVKPTEVPTYFPTFDPTEKPTYFPTFDPTEKPTYFPTFDPTEEPTYFPTSSPTVFLLISSPTLASEASALQTSPLCPVVLAIVLMLKLRF